MRKNKHPQESRPGERDKCNCWEGDEEETEEEADDDVDDDDDAKAAKPDTHDGCGICMAWVNDRVAEGAGAGENTMRGTETGEEPCSCCALQWLHRAPVLPARGGLSSNPELCGGSGSRMVASKSTDETGTCPLAGDAAADSEVIAVGASADTDTETAEEEEVAPDMSEATDGNMDMAGTETDAAVARGR